MSQAIPANAARDRSLDVIRALAVLYIVTIIHPLYFTMIGVTAATSLLLIEMPPIFIVAGAALAASGSNYPYLIYLQKRVSRIVIPYWIYCIAATLTSLAITYSNGHQPALPLVDLFGVMLNPFARHRELLEHPLAAHLWFVPIYLGVTTFLPFLAAALRRIRNNEVDLFKWFLSGALLFAAIDLAVPETGALSFGRHLVLYGYWAAFGYRIYGRMPRLVGAGWALMAALGLGLVACGGFGYQWDMQFNKFPPNIAFYCFGFAWISGFLLLIDAWPKLSNSVVAAIGKLEPTGLITYAYSIYLWHPFAFLAAEFLTDTAPGIARGVKLLLIAVMVPVFTVALCRLVGRFESIKV